jgi:hypothetical protein
VTVRRRTLPQHAMSDTAETKPIFDASLPEPMADRRCSRPLCESDAEVILAFGYETRHVMLRWIDDEYDPNLLELCARHADRFNPPQGWSSDDHRRQVVDLRSLHAESVSG